MGLLKEGRPTRVLRGVKTLFFLFTMLISLLLFSTPVILAIADALLPSALLSASLSPNSPLSLQTISSHLRNYDFRYSLIDIPLISLIRSALILCVYSCCDGPRLSRGPYLGIATVCSVCSLVYVSLKASFVFGNSTMDRRGGGYVRGVEVALFVWSLGLAVAHCIRIRGGSKTVLEEKKALLSAGVTPLPRRCRCHAAASPYSKRLKEKSTGKKMSTSNASMIDISEIQFSNWKCRCGVRAAFRISESVDNPGMVYFACSSNNTNGCGFFQWWMPVHKQHQWLKMIREESDGNCNINPLVNEVIVSNDELKEIVTKLTKESKQMVVEIRQLQKKLHYAIVIMLFGFGLLLLFKN